VRDYGVSAVHGAIRQAILTKIYKRQILPGAVSARMFLLYKCIRLKQMALSCHYLVQFMLKLMLCDIAQKKIRLSFPIFQVGLIIDSDYRYFRKPPIIFQYGDNLPIWR
jgi:hypothetical protein